MEKRSSILWRLKGMTQSIYEEGVLTLSEMDRLTRAFSIVRDVVNDSTNSSRLLGFNAFKRCNFPGCNKPVVENCSYCLKHKDYGG